jgi:DNA topoisomerase-3
VVEQIVITEKSSQAKDVRAAIGSNYGQILPAEGHLLDLQEPEEVMPDWKRWAPILLRPQELYATRPAKGGNKAAKLKAIQQALRTARKVWLATDCDREGQLIGQEILEHFNYRGEVVRVIFTAQDPNTIREAFRKARPNSDFARLYAAAVARRQADQIYNLSLTRTATVRRGGHQRGAMAIAGLAPERLALAKVCIDLLKPTAVGHHCDNLLGGSAMQPVWQRHGQIARARRGPAEDQALGIGEFGHLVLQS